MELIFSGRTNSSNGLPSMTRENIVLNEVTTHQARSTVSIKSTTLSYMHIKIKYQSINFRVYLSTNLLANISMTLMTRENIVLNEVTTRHTSIKIAAKIVYMAINKQRNMTRQNIVLKKVTTRHTSIKIAAKIVYMAIYKQRYIPITLNLNMSHIMLFKIHMIFPMKLFVSSFFPMDVLS
jgi:hypothetical protein